MPRLKDFQGREDKLSEDLGRNFGNRLMSKRMGKPRESVLDTSVNALLDGSEDEAAWSEAESIRNAGPATGNQLGPPSDDAGDTDPPKTTSVSLRSEKAIDVGRLGGTCPVCSEPPITQALHRLANGYLIDVNGNGLNQILATNVYEPSGELGVRLRYG